MKKVNILVVDDRPEGLLAVKAVLNSPDYNLVMASSGKDALKCLLNDDFAVILLDVQMPGMNGFETASVIKTREKSQNIPIIFMSAINQDEMYVYQGYESGAVDYILKPFDPYILTSKVAIFVEMFRKNILIQEQARKIHESEIKVLTLAMDRVELEGLKRYRHLADSIPQIVFRLYADGRDEFFNKMWTEYTGLEEDPHQNRAWQDAFLPQDASRFTATFEAACSVREPFEIECRIKSRAGSYRWHLFRIQPEKEAGTDVLIYWLGTATDINDRKRHEENQKFLSEAGVIFSTSLDYEKTLENIAQIAVQYMADWCAVDIVDEETNIISTVAIFHKNPDKLDVVKQIHGEFVHDPMSEVAPSKVIETGKSTLTQALPESVMVVPLCVNDKTVGAITFVSSDIAKPYDRESLQVAEELARRASLAYLNSYLYKISQEAVKARNEFLSIASHELNTPITSLKILLQMTEKALNSDDIDTARFSRSVTSSMRQVDRLINLIKILLDVSHIQSGMFTYNFETFDFYDVISELEAKMKDIAGSYDSHLEIECTQSLFVNWDRIRIEQVCTNLLNNAFKYAPGKVLLKVCEELEDIIISVQDFGDGIPEDKLKTIFNRFERADSNHNISGLGLGLFIVDQIVHGHHGQIKVESQLAQGTIFELRIPRYMEINLAQDDFAAKPKMLPEDHHFSSGA